MGKLRCQEMNLPGVTGWEAVATRNHTAPPAPALPWLRRLLPTKTPTAGTPMPPLVTKSPPRCGMPPSAPL